MLIKTLKAHSNGYGKSYSKSPGDGYDHPNGSDLVKMGYAKEAPADDNDDRADLGLPGNGSSSNGHEGLDSAEHDGALDDQKPGPDAPARDRPIAKEKPRTRRGDKNISKSDKG